MLSNYFNKNVKKIMLLLFILFVGAILLDTGIISKCLNLLSTGYTKEVKSVTFSSSGYSSNQAGSVFVQKSAEWTGLHEATIEINVNTNPALKDVDRDIILVLDTSDSMTDSRVESIKSAIRGVSKDIFANTNDRIAIISFNTNSTINTGFTRDASLVEQVIENLTSKGATNYYLALKDVETLLKDYQVQSNRELHMVFITDGYPTEGKGLYEAQYKILKQKHPYMISTGVQYELGSDVISPLTKISDYQYYSSTSDVSSILLAVARASYYYTSFTLEDVINKEYFQINSTDDISVPYGSVDIINDNGSQKVVWKIPDNKLKTGNSTSMKIKVKLKEAYQDVKGYFPTNSGTSVNATSSVFSAITASTKDTPVLKSWYDVTYYSNDPCNINLEKTVYHFPFSSVYIPDDVSIPSDKKLCGDYQFKSWKAVDDTVKIVGDDTFIMPLEDIIVNGTWTSLSISKSMDGTINTRSTFYEILSSKAVMDNIKSDFVNSTTGIKIDSPSSNTNGKGIYTLNTTSKLKYPIHYYRGNVIDNNVLFADFCWKIVRTTDTGGIKLIYNGQPSGGQCTSTGVNTVVGTTDLFTKSDDRSYRNGSLANVGYMYGKEYPTKHVFFGDDLWGGAVEKDQITSQNFKSTYYFGTSYKAVKASEKYNYMDTFQLTNGKTYSSLTTELIGKYTLLGNKIDGFSTKGLVYYVTSIDVSKNTFSAIVFNYDDYLEATASGKNLYDYFYNKAQNMYWYYANDVEYSNGKYTLKDTIRRKTLDYGTNIKEISEKYHYTCMSDSTTCTEVKYIWADTESPDMMGSYIILSNGETIETALDDMVRIPTNENSSKLKQAVDDWYSKNMLIFTSMLEDTIWCNDRSIGSYNGWSISGNSKLNLLFNEWSTFNKKLNDTCSVYDSYTTDRANGNGKLSYPVGLITATEAKYAGNTKSGATTYLRNSYDYWTMTPGGQNNYRVFNLGVNSSGTLTTFNANVEKGIRPMVSLKPGVFLADGDGTSTNPYVIEME